MVTGFAVVVDGVSVVTGMTVVEVGVSVVTGLAVVVTVGWLVGGSIVLGAWVVMGSVVYVYVCVFELEKQCGLQYVQQSKNVIIPTFCIHKGNNNSSTLPPIASG